ncbi:P-loop containing nucleoside triphosphate hydrolase protein [Clavulina sp. PMI_390]|nr:P-loop containing nucleoside triphosphate hydrolase protein [Clavulina sp. PMI_390]
MILFTIIQGLLPAYGTYTQVALLDEVSHILIHLALVGGRELVRALLVRTFDVIVNSNSRFVQQSVRVELQSLQMRSRLRLDIPALADPLIQDLLDESNRFVNAFSSGANTILTPIGLTAILRDSAQIISHAVLVYTLVFSNPLDSSSLLAVVLIILPKIPSFLRAAQTWILSSENDWPDDEFSRRASAVKRRIAHFENLAYSATYKAEVVLFGLADWILAEWTKAMREDMELDQHIDSRGVFVASKRSPSVQALCLIPLALQYTNASFGTASLTKRTVDQLCLSFRSIQSSLRWSFDSTFDLGAFHCAMNLRPYLECRSDDGVTYESTRSANSTSGMKIDIRDLHFTFPGHSHPTLQGVDLSIQPGETVAVVGLNGSGKSTLLAVLARLVDFSTGSFHINGVDVRRMDAADLHSRTSAIFQSFCKFEQASARENVGIGNVGVLGDEPSSDECTKSPQTSDESIWAAVESAGIAKYLADSPHGLSSILGFSSGGMGSYSSFPSVMEESDLGGLGLSGGQWQRIAIARALMRKNSYDLMLIDEANSALDQKGQRELFENLCKQPNHGTIIFVTHRLEALQWADKVAVVEDGRVTAFGTPSQTKQHVSRIFELDPEHPA